MMNIKLALIVSVSAFALQINPVYASLLSPRPSSILDTNTHTHTVQSSAHPRGVSERGMLIDENFQNHPSAVILGHSFSTVILGHSFSSVILRLDRSIQVTKESLFDLDSPIKSGNDSTEMVAKRDNSAGIPRQARNDNSFLAAGTRPSNAFRIQSARSQLAPAGAPRHNQPAANFPRPPVVASVCFISDTEDCRGFKGDTPCTGAGCNPDPGNRCAQEGYIKKVCPAGQTAISTCPYDSSYVSGCKCRTDLLTCTKPYYGVGAECNGKYERCEKDIPRACEEQNPNFTNECQSGWQVNPKDKCIYDPTYGTCCNKCEGYYLKKDIPSGYVADTSKTCASCDGTKYARKCDQSVYVKCSNLGGVSSSGSCMDGSGTYYKECKCPSNYEWASASKSCVCATSFKYSCSGTGYTGGTGTSCNSKYQKCVCATGYTWSNASGCIKCGGEFKFACTGANEVKPSTGGCGGLYTTCLCKTGYTRYCNNPATDCSSLGYKSTSSCEGGLKCPWGNYWFCPA